MPDEPPLTAERPERSFRRELVFVDVDVDIDADAGGMPALLRFAADAAADAGVTADADALLQALLSSEAQGSTGAHNGVALPHCRCPWVSRPAVIYLRLRSPLAELATLDDEPVRHVFVIASTDDPAAYLQTLSGLARRINQPGALEALSAAGDADAAFAVLDAEAPPAGDAS